MVIFDKSKIQEIMFDSISSSTILPFVSELQSMNRILIPKDIVDLHELTRGEKFVVHVSRVSSIKRYLE